MWNKFIAFLLIFILFFTGLFIIVRPKNDFSILENRPLKQLTSLNAKNWLDSTFQNDLESVLADHFFLRRFWVQGFNLIQIKLNQSGTMALNWVQGSEKPKPTVTSESEMSQVPSESSTLSSTQTIESSETSEETSETSGEAPEEFVDKFNLLTEGEPDDAMKISVSKLNKDVNLVNINGQDQMVRSPAPWTPENEQSILKNIQAINQFSKDIPSGDVSAYFVESSRFSSYINSTSNMQTLKPLLDQLEVPHDYFPIERISDIQRNFFHTDHHWNDIGSYKGYRSLVQFMLGDDEKLYYPTDRLTFDSVQFIGSVSRMTGHSVNITPDTLSKLVFELPPYKVFINGDEPDEYGKLSYYTSGDASQEKGFDHYNFLYQKREELIAFETNNTEKENVLFITDSMSNPIREVLAAHFNKSYFISLDIMHQKDKFFKVEDFIGDYPVDRVVFFLSADNLMSDGEMQYFIG